MAKYIKNPFRFDTEVSGTHFCGRKKDIKRLVGYIYNGTNVIMFAKRRLGKSSLVKEIFQNHLDRKILKAHIDIYSVSNIKELYEKLKEGIAESIKANESSLDKLQAMAATLQSYFGGAKISLVLNPSPSLEIEPMAKVYDEAIGDLLEGYFKYLESKNLHAVIAIDEFQKIVSLPDNDKIEEVLRTVISKRKNCAFIFTGSRRNWLLSMFNSPDRPFYKLGIEHHLGPIDEKVFYAWVLGNLKKKDIFINEDAFSYLYSESHGETRFIQLISYMIFEDEKPLSMIDKKTVQTYIDKIVANAFSLPTYFNTFTIVQQNALKIIARHKGVDIYAAKNLEAYGVKKGSLQGAIKKLLDIGAIYEENRVYYFENVELGMWLRTV
ncbi:MAG: Unknown protein [uncultured Sulfurovum sp.]|uniref:ATPase domain-containing protein n=1 Tax=uncultured Sulfurovum sp. TaxID=269237 RepID=A0A6S6UAB2_9BACT|nr:MAG: Unknown protein [uncultured Sulfurovum sp.]